MERETQYSIAIRKFMAEHYLEASDIRDLAENIAEHLAELEPTATNTIRDIRDGGYQMETVLDEMELEEF